jgi:hypothetical protein
VGCPTVTRSLVLVVVEVFELVFDVQAVFPLTLSEKLNNPKKLVSPDA